MSSKNLISLIDNHDISSTGASPTAFTGQWIPSLSAELPLTTGTDFVHLLSWQRKVSDYLVTHHFIVSEQGFTEETLHSLWPRVFSHAVLDLLPERALPELVDTLKTMLEFYRVPVQPKAIPPAPKQVPAKSGKVYTRPEFHVVEE